ncbi:Hypothetical_protein [Hexamita inflata]|uniref:Hypothetical_protein n=1 Tax=Hexamita inflata TaxID=28002 RepID=A0ABP1GUE2_9EUKA
MLGVGSELASQSQRESARLEVQPLLDPNKHTSEVQANQPAVPQTASNNSTAKKINAQSATQSYALSLLSKDCMVTPTLLQIIPLILTIWRRPDKLEKPDIEFQYKNATYVLDVTFAVETNICNAFNLFSFEECIMNLKNQQLHILTNTNNNHLQFVTHK